MDTFLYKRSIKSVPVLVAKVWETNRLGQMEEKKKMEAGWKYGIDGLQKPNYKNWDLNDLINTQYFTNKIYIDDQYNNRKKESEANDTVFPELIFAHDTRFVGILDFDHPQELERPASQMLLQHTPYYDSYVKGLPKVMVVIEDIHTFEHEDRIILHKINGKTSLELLIGQFSYFRPTQPVKNSDKPFYIYKSLQELLNQFDYGQTYTPPSLSLQKTIAPKKEHTTTSNDVLSTEIKYHLDRLIAVHHTWGDSYDNWIWVGFVLHNIFYEYDINMGLELFDYFSQSTKCYDADEVEDKWGDIVRGAENYSKQPATKNSLLKKVEELEDERGIAKPRLLSCSSSSDDTSSLTSSCSSPYSSFDKEQVSNDIFQEIEDLLKLTSVSVIQHSAFKKLLQKVMYNINDTTLGYETYKLFLTTYGKITLNDMELGNIHRAWEKTVALPSHTIKQLVSYVQTNDPDAFKEKFLKTKETYDLVKKNFTGAKIRDPVCFVDIKSNGEIQIMRKQQMEDKYENLKCMAYCPFAGQVIPQSFIKKWFRDEHMKTFDAMDFNPDTNQNVYQKDGMTYLNLFRGLECMNMNKYPSIGQDEMKEELDLFLWLLRHQLCDENIEFYDCLVKLLAHAIQKPGQKWRIMVIFKSIQGIGKGMFLDFFGNCMIGSTCYKVVDNSDQILGNFNACRMNKLLIVLNELSRKDLSEKQGCLKGAITENNQEINGKGKPVMTVRNEANYIGATNHDGIAPEKDDRRLMPIESHASKLPLETAVRLGKLLHIRQKNPRFIAKLRDYFLSIDLSDFVPERDRVITEYYQEMQEILTPHYISFILHYFFVKSWVYEFNQYKQQQQALTYREWKTAMFSKPIGASDFYKDMIDFRREHMNDNSRYTQNMFGRHIRKLCVNKCKEGNIHFYTFCVENLKTILIETYHMTVPEFDAFEARQNLTDEEKNSYVVSISGNDTEGCKTLPL